MLTRRHLVLATVALAGAGAVGLGLSRKIRPEEQFEITRTPDEWRAQLGENRFLVMRKEKTETPYTSALLTEKRQGAYHCAGCDLPVYSSLAKYDSGTGWPSFKEALAGEVGTKDDTTLFVVRTEVHCRRCGGHLGHIFDDGPQPTGLRHCLNGLALSFRQA